MYINGYALALLEKHGALCDLGFSECIKAKVADNSDPSMIIHPPEHTSFDSRSCAGY